MQVDYAALLSPFAELGLKLWMDMPEDSMAIMNFFFCCSIPGKESQVCFSLSLSLGRASLSVASLCYMKKNKENYCPCEGGHFLVSWLGFACQFNNNNGFSRKHVCERVAWQAVLCMSGRKHLIASLYFVGRGNFCISSRLELVEISNVSCLLLCH